MIEVLNPGVFSSIQDGGRLGYKKYGVPSSGFMDNFSAQFANFLLGKPFNAPLIEAAQAGLELRFYQDLNIAVCGAEVDLTCNGEPLLQNRLIKVEAGNILRIKSINKGVWSYLGIQHDLKTDEILCSHSQYLTLTKSHCLKKGDLIAIEEASVSGMQNSRLTFQKQKLSEQSITVYKGPEFHLLSKDKQYQLFNSNFSISSKSNRMAYAFNEKLDSHDFSILSRPVLPGTVQWTPAGELFCLMRDAQTTGGYPRILQLAEENISLLAQKQSGKLVSFQKIM
ncbi:MAG: biotin-dependent carboxyltransferase family protein [Bacteroidota bacterium]